MKLVECPRDAMQGLHDFVATEQKIRYINALLQVGFHTIDFGSFVSAKAIPQMRDTSEVLAGLDLSATPSKLLAIIANVRGAADALHHREIDFLGFPLSISETFQQRNTNKSVDDALMAVKEIQKLCEEARKTLVCYISMGFGNPYGESYSPALVADFAKRLADMGVSIVSLADTIGSSTPALIDEVFSQVLPALPHIEIGAHFHSVPHTADNKIRAAYQAGCRRFDSAMGGMGGCPMAKDDLTGNISTEILIQTLEGLGENLHLDHKALAHASGLKLEIFG